MDRALPALLAVCLLLAAPAQAQRGKTYCVGGYEGTPPRVVAACSLPEVRRMHPKWHEHIWLTNGQDCFICYDEQDNTCQSVFLRENPGYSYMPQYDCARRFGERHTSGTLIAHVIDGQPVTKPPPPPPVQLEARVERVSPGPYTAGDRVTVVGAVRDGQGTARPLSGGVFRVTDASGKSTEHRGTVARDGTVKAEFALPPTDSARIEFVPEKPPLAAHETLRAAASEARALEVEVCGFRARVVRPVQRETLISGESTLLGVRLFDAAGKVPVAAPAGLSLAFTVQVEGEQAVRLPADKEGSASWTPPASPKPREVRISAGGRAGERVVCPAGEVTAVVNDLGLDFDTSRLPSTCYVGLPCEGTVVLRRPPPESGASRQRVDTLLGDSRVEVLMVDTGEERYRGPPRVDDVYTFSATYVEPKSASWSLVLQTPRGPVSMPSHEVQVRPPLRLELPAELDFGTVAAGTAVMQACQRLDFGRSQAPEEHGWSLSAEGLDGCQARPVLAFRNALGQVDTRGLVPTVETGALDPKDLRLDICLEVPRCAGDVSPDSAVLLVVPRTPEFKGQARTVRLRWKVEGQGFLGCHGAWVWPVLGLLGFGLLLAGMTQPARFPPGASIRVAGSERGIRQSSALLLLDCPGSRPGFFRDARLGLHGDGEVNGRTRNAVLLLRATRGAGVVLTGHGPLEQQDRRTLKWEPVTDLAEGHIPSPSVLYRAGGTYFKVEL